MKKIFTTLILVIAIFFTFWSSETFAVKDYLRELKSDYSANRNDILKSESSYFSSSWRWISKLTADIANALRSVFFIIAIVYFFIIAIRLIFSSNTEEEIQNFKKWIIWISVWIVVVNIASVFVRNIYNPRWVEISNINYIKLSWYWNDLVSQIILPLVKVLELSTAFFFILIAIYSFYRLVSSNWNEESAKAWKMTILYAVIWFLVVKVAADLVFALYWNCKWNIARLFWATCNLNQSTNIVASFINWLNSFVALTVIIMVIFTWAQVMFSNWDDEKLTKAKKSIIYIAIWIWILVFDYIILTFFL